MSNSSGTAPFYLKPPLPSGLCRCGLPYDAADYLFENFSEVYGLTFSQKAQVESLNCPLKRDDCKIQCAGRDSRAGVYRHSSRYAYKTEVFDFFWKSLIDARGSSAQSFVSLVNGFYTRNMNHISFVTDRSFREAFFGYMSLKAINFNQPCLQCGFGKDPDTGVVYTKCDVVGYDCVTLHSLKTSAAPTFGTPVAESPTVYCRHDHIFNRLILPGKAASAVGVLRTEILAVASYVIHGTKLPATIDLADLAPRCLSISVLEP